MKKAIFTVITNNYETLLEAPKFDGWDCILFTDNVPKDFKGWALNPKKIDSITDPVKRSRQIKILSHVFLPDYDLVCYIDANMKLKTPPPEKTSYYLHPSRRRIIDEARQIVKIGKEEASKVNIQTKSYYREGFKDNVGLFQLGFFVREHSKELNLLHELWDNEIYKHTSRDQISFPYAAWKSGVNIKQYIRPNHELRRYIQLLPHKPAKVNVDISVHHITPGRSDKNFGKSINDIIKLIPDNDWICLRDIDTMPIYHEQFFKQCEEIANKGEYDLVGCMTNRLGLNWQLHHGQLSGNSDILDHRRIGIERFEQFGSEVKAVPNNYIGGMFMLFPKKTWMAVGGFPEGGIQIKGKFIDWWFCDLVRRKRLKIGIAPGIYLFHLYRIWKEKARDIQHLI